MSFIQSVDLGPHFCHFSYRLETKNEHWSIHHAHQGIELLYVHEGTGYVTVERKIFQLQPGTLICFQPYQLHKVEVAPKENCSYIRTNLTFDPRMMEPYITPFPKLQALLRKLWKGSLSRQVFQCGDSGLSGLLEEYSQLQLRREGKTTDEERALFVIAILRHLQLHIMEEDGEEAAIEQATGHIEPIFDWLEAHFSEPFELQRLADELHLSPYYVSHLFKKYTGSTLSAYIAVRRVREACTLLANTDKPISDIARAVGSFSIPYFCNLFKKHKGVSPQVYRSSLRRLYSQSGEEKTF